MKSIIVNSDPFYQVTTAQASTMEKNPNTSNIDHKIDDLTKLLYEFAIIQRNSF